MYNRALRHGIVTVNPVRGIARAKEPEGRTLYLAPDDEAAVRGQVDPEGTRSGRRTIDARRGDLRPPFTVSVNTGLRWSEERRLEWRDVDFLTGRPHHRAPDEVRLRSPDSDEQSCSPCSLGDGGPWQPAAVVS